MQLLWMATVPKGAGHILVGKFILHLLHREHIRSLYKREEHLALLYPERTQSFDTRYCLA